MLKAGVFDDFKGATTLLLWGDVGGMGRLLASFSTLRDTRGEFGIAGPETDLIVCYGPDKSEGSTLLRDAMGVSSRPALIVCAGWKPVIP